MQKSNYCEKLVLDYLLTANSVTRPTTLYVALHTADPTEAGNVGELTVGNGYARQAVSFDDAAQPYESEADVTFGPCTTADWGTITHGSVWDASTGGNCLYYGALTASRTINVTDSFTIPAGDLTIDEA